MRLTFQYVLKPKKRQQEIIDELIWHSSKVYNILNYEVKEGKEKINPKGNLNIESSNIYKKYRKENWHSEYLHSHTLQEVILNYIGDYKSYVALKEKYEAGNKEIKGKPRMPRYKKEEKYQVKSLNFLIPKKLEKLVNLESIKMIKIGKEKRGRYKVEIIYEREEQKEAKGNNIMAIDLGMNNLASCTNMKNNKSLIIAGESIKAKIGYLRIRWKLKNNIFIKEALT